MQSLSLHPDVPFMHSEAGIADTTIRLSVAMCTFNGGRYLAEQLASIAAQTRLPDEVVICDDGSSDSTVPQVRAFAESSPFPVVVVQNAVTLGYSQNFAQALNLCSGDVIVLSDQDDSWHPTRLQRMHDLFLRDGSARGIFTDGYLMDENSRVLPKSLWSSFGFGPQDQWRLHHGEAVAVLLQRNVVTGMALAIRRDVRQYMLRMPLHWPHDAWLALMLAVDGGLRACPEKLVTYRVHAQQQIGVPITRRDKVHFVRKEGVRAYLRLSRARNIREYTREALQYGTLLQAVDSDAELRNVWWQPEVRAKAEHAAKAAERLHMTTLARILHVLKHRKNYPRYSPTGIAAFWRDLLL